MKKLSILSVLVVLALFGLANATLVTTAAGSAGGSTSPTAGQSGPSCTLSASPSQINVGGTSSVSISCYDSGSGATFDCGAISWAATLGKVATSSIQGSATFTGTDAGTATVTASGSYSNPLSASPIATPFSCQTQVTVVQVAPPNPTASKCTISPNPINAQALTEVPLTITCSAYDSNTGTWTVVPCPSLSVTSTVGSIDTIGVGSYAFNAGTTSGSGTVTASSGGAALQAAGTRGAIGADTTGTGSPLTAALIPSASSSPTPQPVPINGFSCSASATVTSTGSGTPATVQVVPSSTTVAVGSSQTFTAHVFDAAGNELTNAQVTWSIAAAPSPSPTPVPVPAPTAALVNPGSATTSPTAGSACGTLSTIAGSVNSATFTGTFAKNCEVVATVVAVTPATSVISGYALVTVTASSTPVPSSVAVSPSSASVYVGGTQTFTATVADQFGNVMPDAQVTWSIAAAPSPSPTPVPVPAPTAALVINSGSAGTQPSNPVCGTIVPDPSSTSNSATFTGTFAKNCRVVATLVAVTPATSVISGYASVSVLGTQTSVPSSVDVEPPSATISIGGTVTYTATVYDQNHVAMSGVPITWSVSGPITPSPTPVPVPVPAPVSALINTIGSTGGSSPAIAVNSPCGGIVLSSSGTTNSAVFTGTRAATCYVYATVSSAVPSPTPVPVPAPISALISNLININNAANKPTAGTGTVRGTATVTVNAAGTTNGVPASVVVVYTGTPVPVPATDRPTNTWTRLHQHQVSKFTAYVYDASGALIPNYPVTWSVKTNSIGSMPNAQYIGTIDQYGNFRGYLPGTGYVVATAYINTPTPSSVPAPTASALVGSAPSSGQTAIQGSLAVQVVSDTTTITCTIPNPNPSSDTLSVSVNTNTQLSVACSDSAGNVVSCPTMTWGSTIGSLMAIGVQNTAVFSSGTMAGTGTIAAKGVDPNSGTAFSCTLPVTVNAGTPYKVAVSPSSATVSIGGTQQFTAIVFDQNGNQMPNVPVSWQVVPSVAGAVIGSIDSNGFFSANGGTGSGSVVATATSPAVTNVVSGSALIQVVTATNPTVCYVNPQTLTIASGQQQEYTVSCSDNAGNVIACPPTMVWSTTIGTIAPDSAGTKNSAKFTAGDATGTGTVTASDSATDSLVCSGTVDVTSGTPGMPAGVNIDPMAASLAVGQAQKFTATVYDVAGNVLDPNAQDSWYLQWTSDGGIGKVDQNGMFVASTAGAGTVSVEVVGPWMSVQAIKATAKVSVSGTQTGIYCRLDPSELTIPVNSQQAFAASCYDPSGPCANILGCPVTCPVMSWTSTIGSVTVDPAGRVGTATFSSGSVAGTGTVTAAGAISNGPASSLIACSAPVSVTGGTVYSMALEPSSASLQVGDTQTFQAISYDSNGNTIGTIPNSQLQWSVDGGIGAIDPTISDSSAQFTATTAGTGDVNALYTAPSGTTHIVQATAPIIVSSPTPNPNPTPNNGGTGTAPNGAGSGGASYSSSSTLTYTCAGQTGSIQVHLLKPSVTLLAEIWTSGVVPAQRVFSQSTGSDTTFQFSVPQAGDYQAEFSVGAEQRTVSFSVPACTPTTQNATKQINIQVAPPVQPVVPAPPKNVTAPAPVAQAPAPQSGFPAWALLVVAVLLLAGAYFMVFGKKPKGGAPA